MEAYEKMGVKSRRYHEKPVPVLVPGATVTSGSDFTVPLKILNMEYRLREGMKLVEKIRKVTTSEPGATFRKILSFIADALLALIYWPFLAASISFVYVIRFIVQYFFSNSKEWKGYRLVSGADALFGYKAENGSSLIHTATIVQGAPDYEGILSRYNNSVFKFRENNSKKNNSNKGQNIYCKLKQILSFKFGFYCWRDGEENFDITQHVKFYKGNDEENNNNNNNTADNCEDDDIVTEDKLMDILSKLVSEDLPDSRPQWEHLIIPKFKFDHEPESSVPQHFVCVFRIHHAYADGGSLGIFMDTVMADEPLKFAINPYEPFPGVSKWMNLLSDVNMFVKGPADFVRTLKSAVLDQSKFFVKSYSPKKVTAWSDPIDMDTLRDIKRISGGASVPSILLSCITASLKNHHVRLFSSSENEKNSINTSSSVNENDEAIPKTINIGTMSVMLPYENLQLQNHFTTFTLNCPLDESCSVERLRKTNKSCRLSSYSSEPRYNYFVMGLLGNCPKFIQDFFLEIAGTPLIFSNVPGVVEPMKVFGGTLVDTGVWLPHIRAYGMAIATYSYCGKIRICLTADSKIFHTSLQAKEFLKDAQKELDKLASSYEKCKECTKL